MEFSNLKSSSNTTINDRKICRSCLYSQNTFSYSNDERYYRCFIELTGLEVTKANVFPFWVCIYCAALLRNIMDLRKRCLIADDILIRAVLKVENSNIKKPKPDWLLIGKERDDQCLQRLSLSKLNDIEDVVHEDINHSYVPFVECSKISPLKESEGVLLQHIKELHENEVDFHDDFDDRPYSPAMSNVTDESDSQPLALKTFSERFKVKHRKKNKTARKRKKSNAKHYRACEKYADHMSNREELDDLLRNVRIVTEKYTITRLTRSEVLLEIEDRSSKLSTMYKCGSCGRGYKYEDVYIKHMDKHKKKPDYYECDICHQFLSSPILLRLHSKGHFLKYRCNACKKVCGSAFLLKEHYFQKHEADNKALTCHVCGKVMMRMSSLTTHLKRHTDAAKVSCDTCGETFKSMDTLRSHRLSMHSEERPYKCGECPKTFRYSGALSTHKQTHRKTRDFYCVECDIAFKTWHCLKVHLEKTNKHATPETLKHACPDCDKRFGCARLLKHHISWHHHGKKLHPCPHCPKAYGSYEGLRKHVKVIHEGILGEFKYICEYCAKPFRVKAVWRSHVRIHTGERPYSCETCGRSFTQKIAMDTHIKLVHLKLKRNIKKKITEQKDVNIAIPDIPS